MGYAIRIDRIEGVYVIPSEIVKDMGAEEARLEKALIRADLLSGKEVLLCGELPTEEARRVVRKIAKEILPREQGQEFLTSDHIWWALKNG